MTQEQKQNIQMDFQEYTQKDGMQEQTEFITAMAISDGNDTKTAVEYIEGYVTEEVRGENGFGFDEIFELENGKTLAELSQEEKNKISARKKALESLKQKISKQQG